VGLESAQSHDKVFKTLALEPVDFLRVLVADDTRNILQTLAAMITASSGEEAGRLVAALPLPYIITMDQIMSAS
jgi:hypothetical protein